MRKNKRVCHKWEDWKPEKNRKLFFPMDTLAMELEILSWNNVKEALQPQNVTERKGARQTARDMQGLGCKKPCWCPCSLNSEMTFLTGIYFILEPGFSSKDWFSSLMGFVECLCLGSNHCAHCSITTDIKYATLKCLLLSPWDAGRFPMAGSLRKQELAESRHW